MSTPDRPWPLGPYRLLTSPFNRERGKEVGSSVSFGYPKEQYEAWNHARDHAQGSLMMLAPEMAEAILSGDDCCPEDEPGCRMCAVARKIRAIDGLQDWACEKCGHSQRGDYSSSPRCGCGHYLMPKS